MEVGKKVRILAVVLILMVMAPQVHAMGGLGYSGLVLLLSGGVVAGGGALLGDPELSPIFYIAGAACAGAGLLSLIIDAVAFADASPSKDPNGIYLASSDGNTEEAQPLPEKKKDITVLDVLQHVVVGGSKDKFYVGLNFNF